MRGGYIISTRGFLHLSRQVNKNHLSSFRGTNLDSAIIKDLEGSPLPGACVCYIVSKDDGKPAIYTRAYGISRRVGAENIPVRSDTVFPIGPSFFKNMLMIVIMQLVREKRVNLDDNVQDILKEVQFRGVGSTPLQLCHLLSHTSGIREFRAWTDIMGFVSSMLGKQTQKKDALSLQDFYNTSKTGVGISTIAPPGEIYIKSHHNFGLVGVIIEHLTGADLATVLKERIFSPLNMASTGLVTDSDMTKRLSQSYVFKGNGFVPIEKHEDNRKLPVGIATNVFSTAEDLSKYAASFLHPESSNGVITTETLDRLLEPAYVTHAALPMQSFSFGLDHLPGRQDSFFYLTCGQGMTWSGYQSSLVFSRTEGVGVVILANAGSHSYEASTLSATALQFALEQGSTDKKANALSPAAETSRYDSALDWPKICGVYQLPMDQLSARVLWTLGGEVEVYCYKGSLRLRALWGPLRTKFSGGQAGLLLKKLDHAGPVYTVDEKTTVLSSPVTGATHIAFDPKEGKMFIGLITLKRQPIYKSVRIWMMAYLAYHAFTLIGRGKALDIILGMLTLS